MALAARAQVNVTTYHNDNARTGANTQETLLTPANVNSGNFGKLFTVAVDGYVYAQPLVMSNVQIRGGIHDVLYVATEHDSLYAIDADSGSVYWQVNMIPVGATPVQSTADFKCGDLSPESGISGTPVIDAAGGTIYLVTASTLNGTVSQYLHGLDIQTGAEKFGGPTYIQASAPGTAVDGDGTTVSFTPRQVNQRAGLLLANGHVLAAFASHCDIDPWHGWVLSYGASSLALEGVFNPSSGGRGNGVWMSGGAPAADASGNFYVVTGNGTWNPATGDYGESVIKLSPPSGGALKVLDYFTPQNQAALTSADMDLSSGGLTLLPALASGKQYLVTMGKEGKAFLLDTGNLGKNCAAATPACSAGDPQIPQEISGATVGLWGSPVYWNGRVYWGAASGDTGAFDYVKAFSFDASGSGLLSSQPVSMSTNQFGYTGFNPSLSSNGNANAILWGMDNSRYGSVCSKGTNCQVLYAYDATNLGKMLYNSNQAANQRDVPGSAVKFTTPTVANGKVYVGSNGAVSAYGLLGSFTPTAPTPGFVPGGGTFSGTQSVTLTDTLGGAVIHYTVDGSTATPSSPIYAKSFTLSKTTTVQAMAVAAGYQNSPVASATYTLGSSGGGGTSGGSTAVSLTPLANIYAIAAPGTAVSHGGMDTQGYAYSAALLGTAVTWSGTTFTLGAAGAADAVGGGTLALPAGQYATLQVLGAAVQGNHVNQKFVVNYTDGSSASFTQSMSDWTSPQGYPGESKVLTMASRVRANGALLNAATYLYGYSFALNPGKTVASVALPANRDIVILAVAAVPTGGGTQPPPVNAPQPTFSPGAESFTTSVTVSLSDSLAGGAAIHYTVDGSTPTPSSPLYTAPLQLVQTTTIKAIAVATGYADSAVASAAYGLQSSGGGTGGMATPVSLGGAANVYAIFNDGQPVTNGGMDTQGYAYSSKALGAARAWSGSTFQFATAGAPDAMGGGSLALPSGKFAALKILGAAVQGSHVKQVFTVTYTDGTSDSFMQSMSDWTAPQSYSGEATAAAMTYRIRGTTGQALNGAAYLYGYTFALNPVKTVASLTPPANRDIVLLAVGLQ